MKVRILTSALNDLATGREFYDEQDEGLGDDFFDSVFADIDALALYAGIHLKVFGCHRRLARVFRMRFIIEWITMVRRWFIGFWIVGRIH